MDGGSEEEYRGGRKGVKERKEIEREGTEEESEGEEEEREGKEGKVKTLMPCD